MGIIDIDRDMKHSLSLPRPALSLASPLTEVFVCIPPRTNLEGHAHAPPEAILIDILIIII